MKDTARKKDRSQGTSHIGQLALAAIFEARATLYERVVHAGMGVLAAMLEEDRTRLCGRRYEHDRARQATRGGHTEGELPFGGRRVRVRRPRVRGSDGREVPLPTWEHFADADPLTPRAVEQMVLGVSTRNYDRSLEPTPAGLTSRGASKSAVSRRFVGATTQTLTEMMGRDVRSSSTASTSATTSWPSPWASTSGAKSTCWGYTRAQPKTRARVAPSSRISWLAACAAIARGSSSSTVARLWSRRSARPSAGGRSSREGMNPPARSGSPTAPVAGESSPTSSTSTTPRSG